jgi:maltooligosyltrehalose trehalohydrolase
VLRFFGPDDDHRLLIVNLGRDLHLRPAPEPLLAPVFGCGWRTLWYSEHPKYGGIGTATAETEENWFVPGHSTVVLTPKPGDASAA